MDAGVFRLSVFPHHEGPERQRLLHAGEVIQPSLESARDTTTNSAVSLIVPTFFNRPLKQQSLRHLLNGIERSRSVREVILVTSGVNDVADFDPASAPAGVPLRFVSSEMNRRAQSRNLGAEAATHDLLLYLDDDMLVHDWSSIDDIAAELLRRNYDCALFPRRHYLRFPWLYDECEAAAKIAHWRRNPEVEHDERDIYDPVRHGYTQPLTTFCFPGCFMLISREAYGKIGGFSEEYAGWGFEDTQFAMQATTHLNVLNLFRKSHALLHIDHPVSPYKSLEYQENLERFNQRFRPWDMARLTDLVLSGTDFRPGSSSGDAVQELLSPFVAAGAALPFDFPPEPVRRNYTHILESRINRGLNPRPEWVVLHGSRGNGTANSRSDFDLLVLFRRGISTDFFVCRTGSGHDLELEYSDCARFEHLAAGPAYAPVLSAMELSKLAQAQVLYGDDEEFRLWTREVMTLAVKHGRAVWFLMLLAMDLNPEKHGVGRVRVIQALVNILTSLDRTWYERDLVVLRSADSRLLRQHLLRVLDEDVWGWRTDLAAHKRVFASQSPEMWSALTSLAAL